MSAPSGDAPRASPRAATPTPTGSGSGSTSVDAASSPAYEPIQRASGATLGTLNKRLCFQEGRVYLDSSRRGDSSFFEGVPEQAWRFCVGGYPVLYKWLYARRGSRGRPGRTLTGIEIARYPQIVAAIVETIRLMGEVDAQIAARGGWPIR